MSAPCHSSFQSSLQRSSSVRDLPLEVIQPMLRALGTHRPDLSWITFTHLTAPEFNFLSSKMGLITAPTLKAVVETHRAICPGTECGLSKCAFFFFCFGQVIQSDSQKQWVKPVLTDLFLRSLLRHVWFNKKFCNSKVAYGSAPYAH